MQHYVAYLHNTNIIVHILPYFRQSIATTNQHPRTINPQSTPNMAVSCNFFLAYSQAYIRAKRLENSPVTIRCEIRYTLDGLPYRLSRNVGGQLHIAKFSTPHKIAPKYWGTGRAKTSMESLEINRALDEIALRAKSLHGQYLQFGQFPSEKEFILQILGSPTATEKTTMFQDYERYIEYLRNRRLSAGSIRAQDLVMRVLKQFQKSTGYRIEYGSINKTFAAKFTAWCETNLPRRRTDQNLNRTARKYLDDLKIFMSHALSEGWTDETLFRQIKISFPRNAFPTTLTEEEIAKMMAVSEADIAASRGKMRYQNTQFAANAIISRDLFVFATQTAIRHSDWQRFAIVDVPRGKNIRFYQEKTEGPLEVPLSGIALAILEKYDGRLPADFTTAATNKHLAAVAAVAVIRKHVTTHVGRRTFCTLQEKAGVPRSIIMRITGHRTEKDYLRYVGITFEYNADALRKANPDWFRVNHAQ